MNSLFMLSLGFTLVSRIALGADFYDNSVNAPHLSLIQTAQRSIDIEIYTMDDPEIRDALLKAQGRGVKLRIIQEPSPVGASCKLFKPAQANEPSDCPELRGFVQQVHSLGGDYVPFVKAALCTGTKNCYEHGKILLVDRKQALLSTGNFDKTSICDTQNGASRCNRDFSVVTKDVNEVDTLEKIFEKDLVGQSYDLQSIVSTLPSYSLTVSPYSLDPIVRFLQSAKNTIEVENQYLHDADLNAALVAAASRGVRVQVMISSICSFGTPSASVLSMNQKIASEFEQAGIRARAFTKKIRVNGSEGYLHAKAIVVDHQKAWVGSVNGSTTALSENREYGIFFSDGKGISDLENILISDFSNPGSTSYSEDLNCHH